MPIAVIMPKYEMTQETGTVGSWLRAEGDAVRKGDPILEIETDKVSMDVESPADGTLVGISAQAGQVVPVGQPIAYVLKAGETWPAAAGEPAQAAKPARPATPPAARPASHSPVSASPLAARMAADLGVDLTAVTGTGPRGQVTKKDIEAHVARTGNGHVPAVPAARRLARELHVDLNHVRGTGPGGRIQSADVRMIAAKRDEIAKAAAGSPLPAAPSAAAASAVSTPSSQPPAPTGAGAPNVRRTIPLTSIRRTIAERMATSVREAPQFAVSVDVDMTRALAIVEDLKAYAAPDQPRVTLTVLLIRACAWALAQHPEANSAFVDGHIAEWDEVNVGVATAIDSGLIVPVVRSADQLGMRAIAAQLADLSKRAREGQLKLEDLQGGTFTLSNLGMFGIDRFTAILNPPQAAILAVGRLAKRAVVTDDDRVEVRPLSTFTLTADHRVLDGASAARFLATIQRALEHPGQLMA